MTELKLTLPDSLARDARKAGLLTPKAIGEPVACTAKGDGRARIVHSPQRTFSV